ncbi:MAG: hypothetical protein V3U24_05755 [Candidatus Neomarinimicrobiota bacterium]
MKAPGKDCSVTGSRRLDYVQGDEMELTFPFPSDCSSNSTTPYTIDLFDKKVKERFVCQPQTIDIGMHLRRFVSSLPVLT